MSDTITMRRLGTHGQWGNQVIQYAFVRTYARRHKLAYQVPPWAGQYFYGHKDPPVTAKLPAGEEHYGHAAHERCFAEPIPPHGREYAGCDWIGWGQFHTSWYARDRESIRNLFTRVVEPEHSRVTLPLCRLMEKGDTIISLHLRRSDGGRMIYFHTPIAWCLRWLSNNWERFERPVLFIATEAPELVEHFRDYGPIVAEDLGIGFRPQCPPEYIFPHTEQADRARQMDFFPDWYLLQHSDVVLASESTFPFTAAWTSRVNKEFWRPRLSLRDFEQVDPWNTEMSPREHLDDFPGIPGTSLDSNVAEYWGDYRNKHAAVPETQEEIDRWKP